VYVPYRVLVVPKTSHKGWKGLGASACGAWWGGRCESGVILTGGHIYLLPLTRHFCPPHFPPPSQFSPSTWTTLNIRWRNAHVEHFAYERASTSMATNRPSARSRLGKRTRGQEDDDGSQGQSQLVPTAATNGTGEKLFRCGSCDKSYSRVDHLSRHVRLHTQVRTAALLPASSHGSFLQ
jgi:hypothetical protein